MQTTFLDEPTSSNASESNVTVYTIGFTQKSAERFFGLLKGAGVKRLIDTRLFPDTQLSGFAKKRDLPFLLSKLEGISYEHVPALAPSDDMLRAYKNKLITWDEYEVRYLALIRERKVDELFSPEALADVPTAFLCAEATDQKCHRRLLVNFLQDKWTCLSHSDLR